MNKFLLCLTASCLFLPGCSRSTRDLTSRVIQLDEAANIHNVDGFVDLMAEDAVGTGPDGTVHQGRDQIRAWFRGLVHGFHVESMPARQSGDTVMWTSTVWSDAFAGTGVYPVGVKTTAIFSGDKIKSFSSAFDKQTVGKMKFRDFFKEVVDGGRIDAIDKFLSVDFTEHEEMPPGSPSGREGVKAWFTMLKDAFPDIHVTPKMFVADRDIVVAYATWEGTNTGKFMGKTPTKKKVSFDGVDMVRMANGKAVEHWGLSDMTTLMKQLYSK